MRGLAGAILAAVWLGIGPVAAQQAYEDWEVGALEDGSGHYAGTMSETGSVLLETCFFGGRCRLGLLMPVTCEQGASYPALVNSDKGAIHILLVCEGPAMGLPEAHRFGIHEYAAIREIIRQATRIGFAITMEDDEFRVFRFSLKGATAAMTFIRDATVSGAGQKGLRDARM